MDDDWGYPHDLGNLHLWGGSMLGSPSKSKDRFTYSTAVRVFGQLEDTERVCEAQGGVKVSNMRDGGNIFILIGDMGVS